MLWILSTKKGRAFSVFWGVHQSESPCSWRTDQLLLNPRIERCWSNVRSAGGVFIIQRGVILTDVCHVWMGVGEETWRERFRSDRQSNVTRDSIQHHWDILALSLHFLRLFSFRADKYSEIQAPSPYVIFTEYVPHSGTGQLSVSCALTYVWDGGETHAVISSTVVIYKAISHSADPLPIHIKRVTVTMLSWIIKRFKIQE